MNAHTEFLAAGALLKDKSYRVHEAIATHPTAIAYSGTRKSGQICTIYALRQSASYRVLAMDEDRKLTDAHRSVRAILGLANSLRRLDHPLVEKIIDVFDENGKSYVIFDAPYRACMTHDLQSKLVLKDPKKFEEFGTELVQIGAYVSKLKFCHLHISPETVAVDHETGQPVFLLSQFINGDAKPKLRDTFLERDAVFAVGQTLSAVMSELSQQAANTPTASPDQNEPFENAFSEKFHSALHKACSKDEGFGFCKWEQMLTGNPKVQKSTKLRTFAMASAASFAAAAGLLFFYPDLLNSRLNTETVLDDQSDRPGDVIVDKALTTQTDTTISPTKPEVIAQSASEGEAIENDITRDLRPVDADIAGLASLIERRETQLENSTGFDPSGDGTTTDGITNSNSVLFDLVEKGWTLSLGAKLEMTSINGVTAIQLHQSDTATVSSASDSQNLDALTITKIGTVPVTSPKVFKDAVLSYFQQNNPPTPEVMVIGTKADSDIRSEFSVSTNVMRYVSIGGCELIQRPNSGRFFLEVASDNGCFGVFKFGDQIFGEQNILKGIDTVEDLSEAVEKLKMMKYTKASFVVREADGRIQTKVVELKGNLSL
ncbi:MAG: hypothetical protein AAF429_04155 [Pseudomonadota bacterium]